MNYTPDPGVPRTFVNSAGEVKLQVQDVRRAETPDWIADKKNGYGMRLANVLAQRPVVDLVRDAVSQELSARGFRVGEGRTAVTLDITRLEAVFQIRFLAVGATGQADFAVQVRRPDGSIAYARNFSAFNDNEDGLAGTAGQARRAFEAALSKIVGQMMSDPAFITAISSGARLS